MVQSLCLREVLLLLARAWAEEIGLELPGKGKRERREEGGERREERGERREERGESKEQRGVKRREERGESKQGASPLSPKMAQLLLVVPSRPVPLVLRFLVGFVVGCPLNPLQVLRKNRLWPILQKA